MTEPSSLRDLLFDLRRPLRLVRQAGSLVLAERDAEPPDGFVPALLPDDLGDTTFRASKTLISLTVN